LIARTIKDKLGQSTGMWGIVRDIAERKQSEEARERLILQLQDALAKVRIMSGLLPSDQTAKASAAITGTGIRSRYS
jgi:hypothetical protein